MQIDYLSPSPPLQNTMQLFQITTEIKPCLFRWKDTWVQSPRIKEESLGLRLKRYWQWTSSQMAAYLRAQCFQLGSGHSHQLHSLFVVGDGAGEVGNLQPKITQLYGMTNYGIALCILFNARSAIPAKSIQNNTNIYSNEQINQLYYICLFIWTLSKSVSFKNKCQLTLEFDDFHLNLTTLRI